MTTYKKTYKNKEGEDVSWEYEYKDNVKTVNQQLTEDLEKTREQWKKDGFEKITDKEKIVDLPIGTFVKYITKDGKARSGGFKSTAGDKFIFLMNKISNRGWSVQYENISEAWVKIPKKKLTNKSTNEEESEEETEEEVPVQKERGVVKGIPLKEIEEIIGKVYYDTKDLVGIRKLYHRIRDEYPTKNITYANVRDFLHKQELYQLTKNIGRTTKQRALVPKEKLNLVYIDLIDYSKKGERKGNRTYKYLFSAVDAFSKYGWLIPQVSKSPEDTLKSLKTLLQDPIITSEPKAILTDRGGEFEGVFNDFLKENKINHIYTLPYSPNGNKAEIFNKTVKNMIKKSMILNNDEKWMKASQDAVDNYNKNIHTTIEVAPIDAMLNVDEEMNKKIYENLRKKRYSILDENEYEVGDLVRLTEWKDKIKRKDGKYWTNEVFEIYKKIGKKNLNPIRYLVKSLDGEAVIGSFTYNDLQRVPDGTVSIEDAKKKYI